MVMVCQSHRYHPHRESSSHTRDISSRSPRAIDNSNNSNDGTTTDSEELSSVRHECQQNLLPGFYSGTISTPFFRTSSTTSTKSRRKTRHRRTTSIPRIVVVLLQIFFMVTITTLRHGGERIAPILMAANAWTVPPATTTISISRTRIATAATSRTAVLRFSQTARAENRPGRPSRLPPRHLDEASRYTTTTTTTTLCSSPRLLPETIPRNIPTTARAAAATQRNSLRLFSAAPTNTDGTTTVVRGADAIHNDSDSDNNGNAERWKESPLVNPTITFETLLVPNSQLTRWITHPGLQDRLAKPDNWDLLRHIHPRIKLVQDYVVEDDGDGDGESNNNKNKPKKPRYKQLLLMPDNPEDVDNNNKDAAAWFSELLSSEEQESAGGDGPVVTRGSSLSMSIAPHQLTFQYLLKQLLPEAALPPPSAYEQIGHVAHFNLKEHHLPYKHLIGSALLASTTSGGDSIRTVVNKVGMVDGKFRTYECEILANTHRPEESDSSSSNGDATTKLLETTVVEDGISIELNVAECYWCTRLSGERQELLRDILRGRKVPKPPSQPKKKKKQGGKPSPSSSSPALPPPPPPLVVADVFCGAGAVCMLLAKKVKDQDKSWKPDLLEQQQKSEGTAAATTTIGEPSVMILANDWNPKAIEYMKRSIIANGMDKEKDKSLYHRFETSCGDSYDFLSALGEELPATKTNPYVKQHNQLQRLRKRGRGNRSSSSSQQTTPTPTPTAAEPPAEPEVPPPRIPDHVLMNFPLEAPRFLGALRWWSWKRLRDEEARRSATTKNPKSKYKPWHPRFHVYTFARSSSPRAGDEDEMAVNLVADELLPRPDVFEDNTAGGNEKTAGGGDNTAVYRREELDDEFGTSFSTRIVRDVAPGKVVVCVSFSVTPKLIRYMQGDYS